MMFANEQMTSQMSQLFDEGKRYWNLQKEYLSLHGAEMLTRLLSAVALALVLILVGSMVLLFGSFALAYWLGELLGSHLWGFAIIAGVLLLIALLVYANRIAWIVRPTTRFMVNLLASSLTVPTLEGITIQKNHLAKQIDENQREIKATANTLLSPPPETKNKWDTAASWFQNGLTLYRGLQMGASAIVVLRRILKLGRKRK